MISELQLQGAVGELADPKLREQYEALRKELRDLLSTRHEALNSDANELAPATNVDSQAPVTDNDSQVSTTEATWLNGVTTVMAPSTSVAGNLNRISLTVLS